MFLEPTLALRAESRAYRMPTQSGPLKPVDARGDLQFLFKAYDSASLDFDADAVAAFYDLPCLISTPEGNTSFTARGELRAAFARHFAAFRQRGLVSASMTSLTIKTLSADFAQSEIVWTLSNTRGVEVVSFACAYSLRCAGGRWRIAHAVALDEAEKLATPKLREPVLKLTPRV